MKWKNRDKKCDYLQTFTTDNWKKLPAHQKKKHTMGNCKACALQYSIQQQHFPGHTFSPTTKVAESVKQIIQGNSSLQNPAAITTRQILEEIEPQFKKAYQSTKEPGTKVQIKPTANEKKKFKRKMQRDCTDAMNEQFLNADPTPGSFRRAITTGI